MGLFGRGFKDALQNASNRARQEAQRQAYKGARRAAKVAGSQRSIGSPVTQAASKRQKQIF